MKKIYSLILASMLFGGLQAQTPITGMQTKELHRVQATSNKTNVADTITTYLDRATQFYILTAGSSGYVLGSSTVSGETGQHYDAVGNALVNELMVYFVHKEIMGGTPDDITGHVYSVGADSMPTTLLGSGTVNAADIDTSGFPTFIALNNTTYANAGFFVSVQYDNVDDTVALFSTNPTNNSGGPDGANEKRCRQWITALAAWARAWEVWTIGGAPYNADALVIPIVDISGGASADPATTPEMNLFGAYPNPASDMTTIRYTLEKPQTVKIVVFDQKGQIVGELPASIKGEGTHEAVINLNNYAAGRYYYTISTDNHSLTSKFNVVK